MKQITKLLALTALLVAGQAVYCEAPPYQIDKIDLNEPLYPKDVQKLQALLEQRKTAPNTPINMPNADLVYVDLAGANLVNANLVNAKFNSEVASIVPRQKTTLEGANLTGTNLSGAYLAGINLKDTNFTNANLTGAQLYGTIFDKKTNFSGANLTKVDFTDSDSFDTTIINNKTNFQGAIGLTPEQKAYARSKGAQNVPN